MLFSPLIVHSSSRSPMQAPGQHRPAQLAATSPHDSNSAPGSVTIEGALQTAHNVAHGIHIAQQTRESLPSLGRDAGQAAATTLAAAFPNAGTNIGAAAATTLGAALGTATGNLKTAGADAAHKLGDSLKDSTANLKGAGKDAVDALVPALREAGKAAALDAVKELTAKGIPVRIDFPRINPHNFLGTTFSLGAATSTLVSGISVSALSVGAVGAYLLAPDKTTEATKKSLEFVQTHVTQKNMRRCGNACQSWWQRVICRRPQQPSARSRRPSLSVGAGGVHADAAAAAAASGSGDDASRKRNS